jgi:hypothetical protein
VIFESAGKSDPGNTVTIHNKASRDVHSSKSRAAIMAENRNSTYTQASTSTDPEAKSGDAVKKDMWSSMLDGVASGKKLPEKNVLVLGSHLQS